MRQYLELMSRILEEGVEKPDARIFEIALERTGVQAEDVLHVGDSAVDDWQGAKRVGMRALLIDRDAGERSEVLLTSLLQLAEELGA